MPENVARQHLLKVKQPDARLSPDAASKPTLKRPVRYPNSDGKPMADSIEQAETIAYAGQTLGAQFRHRSDILVAMDLLVYYREGDPTASVAPDVMVVRGVNSGRRGSYRIWTEGKPPEFVLEVLSKGTHSRDHDPKRKLYAEMGVLEYFRFDPLGTAASLNGGKRLVGELLTNREYRTIPRAIDGSIPSDVLGLDLRVRQEGRDRRWHELRFRDPSTGKDLPTQMEERERLINQVGAAADQVGAAACCNGAEADGS